MHHLVEESQLLIQIGDVRLKSCNESGLVLQLLRGQLTRIGPLGGLHSLVHVALQELHRVGLTTRVRDESLLASDDRVLTVAVVLAAVLLRLGVDEGIRSGLLTAIVDLTLLKIHQLVAEASAQVVVGLLPIELLLDHGHPVLLRLVHALVAIVVSLLVRVGAIDGVALLTVLDGFLPPLNYVLDLVLDPQPSGLLQEGVDVGLGLILDNHLTLGQLLLLHDLYCDLLDGLLIRNDLNLRFRNWAREGHFVLSHKGLQLLFERHLLQGLLIPLSLVPDERDVLVLQELSQIRSFVLLREVLLKQTRDELLTEPLLDVSGLRAFGSVFEEGE